ncbi:hypothetical protein AAVH_24592 [Aphelenchoides avenae]|nr:hypothetical protein AAVH_24592 [Aphelenchus avenae]
MTRAAIFFDPGSELTLIKESLAQRLELKPLREAQMAFETVNTEGNGRVRGHIYEAKVHQDDGTARSVEAFGVKTLIGRVKKLKIANHSEITEEDVEPEILVGVQDFWNFVKGTGTAKRGLTLVDSTLGTILCGRRSDGGADVMPTPNEVVSPEETYKVCDAWEAEGIGVIGRSMSRPSDGLQTGGCMAGRGVANPELSERSKKAVGHERVSLPTVPGAQSLIVGPATCSLLWTVANWTLRLLGSVADCFHAVAMTRPFCSAVDGDELLRRKEATTSADGMFLFDPQDAKEP